MVTPETCEALIQQLNGDEDEVAYLIVCDGSGMTARDACGHYAALYSRRTRRLVECRGGASHGTNNYAELMPFVHALWLLETMSPIAEDRLWPRCILCVSDSELTCRCGSCIYTRKANLALWAAIDHFVNLGYTLTWRHVPRNSNIINAAADAAAARVRKGMNALQHQA